MIAIGEHCMLREVRLSDAEDLFKLGQDAKVMQYYGMEPYTHIEEALDEIAWFESLERENKGFRWVIVDKDDVYIGNIGVFNFDARHNRVELGYKLARSYWGKGIMSQCIQTVLKQCFEVKYYNRVEAIVDPRNEGSRQVLLKNGFTYEGRLREYEFEKGQYIDVDMFSVLQSDYYVMNK